MHQIEEKSMPKNSNWLTENWFLVYIVVFGVWVWMPFLAPVFMYWGWIVPANLIYRVYSFFCHQLPERSYFLFGEQISYSLSSIQAVWMNTNNPLLLGRFIGSSEMGWKIAWSDRMISLYNGFWVFSLFWYAVRKKIPMLPVWGLISTLLPMALDGGTHFISDLAGHGEGFRISNQWLVSLTHETFPATFYQGSMLGSFNAWMRIFTGLVAAIGLAWFAFPFLYKTLLE